MIQHTIILASGSPRRKELLEQMGVNPLVIPSRVEERITETDPALVVEELSCQKAEDVALNWGTYMIEASESESPLLAPTEENVDQVPIFDANSAIVIGADTVVSCDGKILGKPKTHEDAYQMIASLQGRLHQVYTGVTIIQGGVRSTFHEVTDVRVIPMSQQEIREYANTDEPMDKAGAYGIQGSFGKFIDRIEGDYYNVVGLPLARVYEKVRELQ